MEYLSWFPLSENVYHSFPILGAPLSGVLAGNWGSSFHPFSSSFFLTSFYKCSYIRAKHKEKKHEKGVGIILLKPKLHWRFPPSEFWFLWAPVTFHHYSRIACRLKGGKMEKKRKKKRWDFCILWLLITAFLYFLSQKPWIAFCLHSDIYFSVPSALSLE